MDSKTFLKLLVCPEKVMLIFKANRPKTNNYQLRMWCFGSSFCMWEKVKKSMPVLWYLKVRINNYFWRWHDQFNDQVLFRQEQRRLMHPCSDCEGKSYIDQLLWCQKGLSIDRQTVTFSLYYWLSPGHSQWLIWRSHSYGACTVLPCLGKYFTLSEEFSSVYPIVLSIHL